MGALTLFFIIIEFALVAQNRLLPGVMMLGAFILLVLFLTGLIETAIQLFGAGNVSENCQRYVNKNKIYGVSASTLAWLEQNSICEFKGRLKRGDKTNMFRLKLVRRIQLLDCGHHFFRLDDGHVLTGGKRYIRRCSSSLGCLTMSPFHLLYIYIFIAFLIFLFDLNFGEGMACSSLSTGNRVAGAFAGI